MAERTSPTQHRRGRSRGSHQYAELDTQEGRGSSIREGAGVMTEMKEITEDQDEEAKDLSIGPAASLRDVELAFDEMGTGEVERLFSNLELRDGKFERREGSELGATSLVAGTTVGAGILALPAVTLPSGVIPSSLTLILCWVYMVASGLLIAEVNLNTCCNLGQANLSLLSMAEQTIGKWGSRLSGLAYVFIHYALLVAYMAQGGEILGVAIQKLTGMDEPLPQPVEAATFAVLFGGFLFLGSPGFVEKVNNVFVLVVITSFLGLLTLASTQVDPSALLRTDWKSVAPAIPVMFVALVYHNVVPVICTQLEGSTTKITNAIVRGSAIPLVMFLLWNAVIIGGTDIQTVKEAAGDGEIFDPLAQLRGGSGGAALGSLVSVFSEFAIVTSFIGFVIGLLDFLSDLWRGFPSLSKASPAVERAALYCTILIPPAIVAAIDPQIFFGALDNAGTFGISVLFGIIPAAMAWNERYNTATLAATPPLVPGGKITLAIMIGIASALIVEQVLDKTGVI
ncbi:unnamed protein product [Vitrella brassicaformis CCMP3155]|uniref:Amino acid transporter transmembrane domain-containing protein n=2 Tax=Vitrella brassicaformis TaxID=1169539 RepID=A0A0G4F457_VITBC|nr:unnamed protein product [Vitrella brassicaformis CCMP3155]|eukprot:CEM06813.1 unnamed protein product [Vitrella brassicaformis CCMP3155]